jgi:OOP family OmpA-OmpF porin
MSILKFLTVFAMMVSIFSCSNAPVTQEFSSTASAGDEIQRFESDLNASRDRDVHVLSPYNFERAEDALSSAKKSLDRQKKEKDTLHQIAEGKAYLLRANDFSKVALSNLTEVMAARDQAKSAEASTLLKNDFAEIDSDLKDVTKDIENNKFKSSVKQKSNLQLAYLGLELRAIKLTHLSKPQQTIAQAKKEGAAKFAPRTLAIAEQSYQELDAYITANRHEQSEIMRRHMLTQKKADHAMEITANSKKGSKTSSEDSALKLENAEDMVVAKQNQVDDKMDQLETKETQIVAGRMTNQNLRNQNANLEDTQAFNQQFEIARAEFAANEADVYKQGNTLMIRLKGLEFPVAQATLQGSNFALLAKVQKVIKSFKNSAIVVEGHTDSSGGKSINEKLSTDRAAAVKDYLLTINTGEALNIRSLGYDYQKPLSSNKTVAGRAKNRRVDVLISAEQM